MIPYVFAFAYEFVQGTDRYQVRMIVELPWIVLIRASIRSYGVRASDASSELESGPGDPGHQGDDAAAAGSAQSVGWGRRC